MTQDDENVAVYFGEDTNSLLLKTLLEGSGIPASVKNFSMSGAGLGKTDVRVFVARRDVERARPLIEHFKKHGQKPSIVIRRCQLQKQRTLSNLVI